LQLQVKVYESKSRVSSQDVHISLLVLQLLQVLWQASHYSAMLWKYPSLQVVHPQPEFIKLVGPSQVLQELLQGLQTKS